MDIIIILFGLKHYSIKLNLHVGIAADRRFGKQMLTLANDFQRVFKMQDNIIMGLSGLGTDVQTFSALM